MSDYDIVIQGGTVATASDITQCDIGIVGEKIVALQQNLSGGKQVIDARGYTITPGGVDAHCHLDQPTSDGSEMADDFTSGSISAAFGGTTTVIPFACQQKGHSVRAAVDDYHRRADNKAVIDYAFHLIVSDASADVLNAELPSLIEQGYTSFKIYMTYDDLKLSDYQILDVLAVARQQDAMAMIHAENSDCIAWLTKHLLAAKKIQPRYHADSRPPLVEREATHRALALAELVDVPVLIVHVSGPEAIEQIRDAQARGLKVYAETCPQYLFLTAEDLKSDGFDGAKCVCSPPPRDKASQREVWNGLTSGVFQVFSSDHAPFRYRDPKGKMLKGEQAEFIYIPNGVPGLETRLPLLFSHGVQRGRLPLTRFVELTSTNPAKIYGLYPTKGSLAVGSDADIVLWDTTKTITLHNDLLHHNVDYTPYAGLELTAWPAITLSRGEVVCRHGELLGKVGRGRFLKCQRPHRLPYL